MAPLSLVQMLVAEEGRPIGPSTPAVTEQEALFLFLVRRLSARQQVVLLTFMQTLGRRPE